MSETRILLVAGATGALGKNICQVAREQGFRVRALGRNRASLEALGVDELAVGDALDKRSLSAALDGVTHVFSCLGASVAADFKAGSKTYRDVDTPANCNLIDAAVRAKVERFVYVSVASHLKLGEQAYVQAHEEVVSYLASSGLCHAVIRPTGFFSAFLAVLEMAKKGPMPSMGNPNAKTNPIHDLELARFGVRALCGDVDGGEVGGPQVLTRTEISQLAFKALGRPAKFRATPAWAVRMMATLIRPFNARVADIFRFYLAASSTDCIAPIHGEMTIDDFFREAVQAKG